LCGDLVNQSLLIGGRPALEKKFNIALLPKSQNTIAKHHIERGMIEAKLL
jgi:hypothetical protein